MSPWRDWYHCMGNTYGTWLPGDERGFRTWRHHRHIEGDYRNPPRKGRYERLHRASESQLTRNPVHLEPAQRQPVLEELHRSLRKWRVPVVAISVGRVHFHILGRFSAHNPRHFLGLAKKESSAFLRQRGLAPEGGLWALKCECKPINDERHYARAFDYILDHVKQVSAVWSGPPETDDEIPDPDGLLLD